MAFTANEGQTADDVVYEARTGGVTFYFFNEKVDYLFVWDSDKQIDYAMPEFDSTRNPRFEKESILIEARFIGANPDPEIIGEDRLPGKSNYFCGNDRSKWHTGVRSYTSVVYKEIYYGIDLKYYGDGRSMKYDFIVEPGAAISNIRIQYDGIESVGISGDGRLEISTSFGKIYENTPYAFQDINGKVREVSASYKISGENIFGFEVNGYDPSYPLVIDPELVYSSYLGGSGNDRGYDITVDSYGFIYVTGGTYSADFPVVNPYQPGRIDYEDVFISKFAPGGDSLIFSTYLGGHHYDEVNAIEVDSNGNVYVAGTTRSNDFPVFNAFQTYHSARDVFLAKLAPQGDSLVFSTYLGGYGDDFGNDLVIDGSRNIYITGSTSSPGFPTVNPYQPNLNSSGDAFITKFAAGGSSLIYSSYLGGNGGETGYGIALGDNNSMYIAGTTNSTDFPTANAYQPAIHGDWDIFVTKLTAEGDNLLFSTYLGGSDEDIAKDIAVDDSGDAYITGYTHSPDFPLINPYQSNYLWPYDIIASRFDNEGDSLIFSTYLGGNHSDYGYSIALDRDNNIVITGYTRSSDFPAINALQGKHGGPIYFYDAFVTMLAPWGSSMPFSTYLGGSYYDFGNGIAVDDSDNVYVTGETKSLDFPILNQYQTYHGNYDAFISKINPSDLPYSYCANCIIGIVDNIESVPVENVYVRVQNTGISDYTNSLGGYSLGNLPAGTYEVSFSHPDFSDSTVSDIQVLDGQLTNVDLKFGSNCTIIGVVVDTDSVPIEGISVTELYFDLYDTTDGGGNFIISGFAPDSSYDIRFNHREYYSQTIENISIGVNETLQLDTIYMEPIPTAINVWFGNPDGSPVEALIGDTFYVDVYMQNLVVDDLVGYMHIPLGTNNQYVVDQLSQSEGQWYYPLTGWDFVEFLDPDPMDSGWTNQSLQGFCNGGEPDPPFYSLTPARVCTFAFRAVNDSSLLGDTVDCFIEGYHPANGLMMIGSYDGLHLLHPEIFISPLVFVELLSCYYITGDVNGDDDYNGLDITYGVSYFKSGPPPPYECECTTGNTWHVSGDVNASCSYNGVDITYGVAYLKGGAAPVPCADCPPDGTAIETAPSEIEQPHSVKNPPVQKPPDLESPLPKTESDRKPKY